MSVYLDCLIMQDLQFANLSSRLIMEAKLEFKTLLIVINNLELFIFLDLSKIISHMMNFLEKILKLDKNPLVIWTSKKNAGMQEN